MKIHVIAIGGSVMHNLALALQSNGHEVTGSDDETCRVWTRDGAGTWLDKQCVFGKKTTTPLVAGAQEPAAEGVAEGAGKESAIASGMRL